MNYQTKRILAILLSWLPVCAFALATDDAQQLSVSSDSFEYNTKTGVWTYTGHIIADQGSRHLIADKLMVYKADKGGLTKVVAFGAPAQISFINKVDEPRSTGYGQTITYDAVQELLVLDQAAKFESGGDSYSAPKINYKMAEGVVNSPKSSQGRTTIVIQPRTKPDNPRSKT